MPDAKGKRPLVVLEDSTLAGMALNAGIVREFPFLSSLGKAVKGDLPRRGCGSCGGSGGVRAEVFTAAKSTIAGLDGTKKRRLKELLNAQNARVTYKNASGKVVQLTF